MTSRLKKLHVQAWQNMAALFLHLMPLPSRHPILPHQLFTHVSAPQKGKIPKALEDLMMSIAGQETSAKVVGSTLKVSKDDGWTIMKMLEGVALEKIPTSRDGQDDLRHGSRRDLECH